MDPSRWHNRVPVILCAAVFAMSCGFRSEPYSGSLDLKKYPWLKDKKIFVDAGHGGLGKHDLFRMGPGGITEEEVNLRVSKGLSKMLREAGARVEESRTADTDISLPERIEKVRQFNPDLLASIHHNGTMRRMDGVNYPTVLIWGTGDVNTPGFEFASLLIGEFNKIMDAKGTVISDFAVFPETGTMLLRETRYICPGVIGEAGFFSDETFAVHLRDPQYTQAESEAYFAAIAEYFNRGIPRAEVKISCPVENSGYLKNLIREKSPVLVISAESGTRDAGVEEKSFTATLDGLPVRIKSITNTLYGVEYGRKLYPGAHSLRFSFRNRRSQHSAIYNASFTVEVGKGDYESLVREGTRLIRGGKDKREGVKMLRAALSMASTDPKADTLIWDLARGYELLGDMVSAEYYRAKIYHFYPESPLRKKLGARVRGYRFPVEYLGKPIDVQYDPALKMPTSKS